MSQPTCKENWLPIPGYEGRYEVSDLGNVRSVERVTIDRRGARKHYTGKTLKPISNGSHFNVPLYDEYGKKRREYVHRLVMLAFVGPCPEKKEVCHSNGNPSDNRLCNLRYGTVSENRLDSVRHRTHPETRKTHCPRGHILAEPNLRSGQKPGYRKCKACKYAQEYIRYHHLQGECTEVYAMYYKKIMEER